MRSAFSCRSAGARAMEANTVYLTIKPISWNRLAYLERWAMQPSCGALVTFAGVVRADQHEGRTVRALFYEAYPEMAERQFAQLVTETTARWSLEAVEIQHRLGLVEVGGISVVVIVSAQHRAMAYAASQFLLEGIKQRVPIWKHTHYDDGTSRWEPGAQEVLDVMEPSGANHADV